jgi:Uma2 family endonuclease
MSMDEFTEAYGEAPFELIDGEKIPMSPNVSGHTHHIRNLFTPMYVHVSQHDLGEVYSEGVFVLEEKSDWVKGSRTPDILFFAKDRIEPYKADRPDWQDKPFILVPDLVVEIVSPTDRYSQISVKVDKYLADGVRMVIVVDYQAKQIAVHVPGNQERTFLSGDATLDCSPVIPGLKIPLKKIFES